MARLNFGNDFNEDLGRGALADSVVTFTLDGAAVDRGAFGRWKWRLRVFRALVWLACRVLRCGLRVEAGGGAGANSGG